MAVRPTFGVPQMMGISSAACHQHDRQWSKLTLNFRSWAGWLHAGGRGSAEQQFQDR